MRRSRYSGPGAKKVIHRPEQALQIAIFNQLTPLMVLQKHKYFFAYHPSNGGYRTPFEANLFKSMGVKAGVSDIVFLFKGGKTVYVELKAGKGKMEESQKNFADICGVLGFEYHLLQAMDVREAIYKIMEILKNNGVPI